MGDLNDPARKESDPLAQGKEQPTPSPEAPLAKDIHDRAEALTNPAKHTFDQLSPYLRESFQELHDTFQGDVTKIAKALQPLIECTMTGDEHACYGDDDGLGLVCIEHYLELRKAFAQDLARLDAVLLYFFDFDAEWTEAETPDDRLEMHWYQIVRLVTVLQRRQNEEKPDRDFAALVNKCLKIELVKVDKLTRGAYTKKPLEEIRDRLILLARDFHFGQDIIRELLTDIQGHIDEGEEIIEAIQRTPLHRKEEEIEEDVGLSESARCTLIQNAVQPQTLLEQQWWEAPLEKILEESKGKQFIHIYRSGHLHLERKDGSMTYNAQFLLDLCSQLSAAGYKKWIFTEANSFLPSSWYPHTEDGPVTILQQMEKFLNEDCDTDLIAAYLPSISHEAFRQTPPAILEFWKELKRIRAENGSQIALMHGDTQDRAHVDVDEHALIIGEWPGLHSDPERTLSINHRKAREENATGYKTFHGIERGVFQLVQHGQQGTGPFQTVGVPVDDSSRFAKLFEPGQPLENDEFLLSIEHHDAGFKRKFERVLVTVEPEGEPTNDWNPVEVTTGAPQPLQPMHR